MIARDNHRIRCGGCGKVLLNYPMWAGQIHEPGHFRCTRCRRIQRAQQAAFVRYAETERARGRAGPVCLMSTGPGYGDGRDEWEDAGTGAQDGIGWYRPGVGPDGEMP